MTGLLLDTHVVLWTLDGSPRLGRRARERITAGESVFVSAAMLVAQAAVERLTLVTADAKLLAAVPGALDVLDARH